MYDLNDDQWEFDGCGCIWIIDDLDEWFMDNEDEVILCQAREVCPACRGELG